MKTTNHDNAPGTARKALREMSAKDKAELCKAAATAAPEPSTFMDELSAYVNGCTGPKAKQD